jgi:gas vesicle protein
VFSVVGITFLQDVLLKLKNRTMTNNRVFWGIVTAAAAGAVIGLLFAPEDGNKLRKNIKKKANSLASELIDALEKSKDEAAALKSKANGYKDDVAEKVEVQVNNLSDDLGTP